MAYMPSVTYVARAIFEIGAETSWEDAPEEEINANMLYARVAIAAIQSWQAKNKVTEISDRYFFEAKSVGGDAYGAWAIYDRIAGFSNPLGTIHDASVAQQIVDALNMRDTQR